MAPGIVRHVATLQIRPVPGSDTWRTLYQSRQAFRRRGKAAGVEIKQVECAGEALQLDFRSLDLRFAEIIQYARTDQAHDEADDGDHHQHLDQGEALLAQILTSLVVCAP